jgi:hypothetical protein
VEGHASSWPNAVPATTKRGPPVLFGLRALPALGMKDTLKNRQTDEMSGLDLTNEALHLLRTAPTSLIVAYFVGSVPFVLGFLYFWSDMSRSAFAQDRCFFASLGIAALFIWMKCWQAFFASALHTLVAGKDPQPWTLRRIFRLIGVQTAIQPYGLILIPIGLLTMLPFYAFHAFFQNVTVLGEGSSSAIGDLIRRSWKQARLWPTQNHYMLWLVSPWVLISGMITIFFFAWMIVSFAPPLREFEKIMWFMFAVYLIFQFIFPLCPFGCIVAGNVAILIVAIPALMQTLLGIQTDFSLSGMHGIFNSTYLMSIFAISYLFLDPVVKAAHALRCFYGESRRTGDDLLVELRRIVEETSHAR